MSEDRINVVVEIGTAKVTLEGPRDFVEAEVRRLTTALTFASLQQDAPKADAPSVVENTQRALNEREFVATKEPRGHVEMVTALAFYLTEQGLEEFNEQDIRRAYLRAGIRPPKVVAQALRDAKNKRDFLRQGSARGAYRLTDHGDNFVRFDLGDIRAK